MKIPALNPNPLVIYVASLSTTNRLICPGNHTLIIVDNVSKKWASSYGSRYTFHHLNYYSWSKGNFALACNIAVTFGVTTLPKNIDTIQRNGNWNTDRSRKTTKKQKGRQNQNTRDNKGNSSFYFHIICAPQNAFSDYYVCLLVLIFL